MKKQISVIILLLVFGLFLQGAAKHPPGVCGIPTKELASMVWRVRSSDETVVAEEIVLQSNGRIKGSPDTNLSRWGIQGRDLLFYRWDGTPSVRFNLFRKVHGKWVASGPFLLWANTTYYLEEVGYIAR